MPGRQAPRLRDAAPKRREVEIQSAVLRYLESLPGVVVLRMNSRVLMLPGKGGKLRPVRFGGRKGITDILGSVPWCWSSMRPVGQCYALTGGRDCAFRAHGPRPFGFEVKRPGEQLDPAQEDFRDYVVAAGWLHARVESVEDVIKALGR